MRTFLALLGGIVIGVVVAHFVLGPIDWGDVRDSWGDVRDQTGDVVGDTATTVAVRAALALQKDFALFGGIEVTVDDGVVTLKGKVADDDQRQLAGLITRGVEGVEKVNNELEIAADSSVPRPEPAVEAAAA